jgi:serine/threonine protein kinase
MSAPASARFVRFGAFQLDLRSRELIRNGIRVRVPGQSIEVLAMLLENRGNVVKREELHQRLWPHGTIVEFEHSINAAVKRLREALEDSAQEPQYIETLPRLGYRFIAEAQQTPADLAAVVSDDSEAGAAGHFRILEKIGSGAMGVVYKAEDTRLGRTVALKFLPDEFSNDKAALDRFCGEARAASVLNHPNICTVYEMGQREGQLFIAMELLEGETLEARIERGPLALPEAVRVALGLLAALQALHFKQLVHRDLKPSNIFLTENGVKIIDFGLARLSRVDPIITPTELSQPGALVGTPSYMSPEQVCGEPITPASDLFAAGAIIFEMLIGRRAFEGQSVADILHNVQYGQVPSLSGSPAIAAVNSVVHRALAKKPCDRHPSSDAMANELREALLLVNSDTSLRARLTKRLIVLPFRVLRPNPETDFLAFSLPDAITSSLSGLESLIVRSSLVAARFAVDAPNLKTIAAEADVDVVLTGTLLTSGSQVRVSTQLMETSSGALIWSTTSQVALRDIFQLQDDLVNRIVESLSLPLTAHEHRRLKHDVPASPTAYEYYLRANLLYHDWPKMSVARDLYVRSIEEDPQYAPAWARLGRCLRLIVKWSGESDENLMRAKDAIEQALQLSPDLPLAHHVYAQLESDLGRAPDAMVRLLGRAQQSSNDPELFAGLTQVCRYCGLLEASVAAHEQARRLDPQVRTSVAHTRFMLGDYSAVAAESSGGDHLGVLPLALCHLGRERDAIELLRKNLLEEFPLPVIRRIGTAVLALLEGRQEDSMHECEAFIRACRDPESYYYFARQFAFMGKPARAIELLKEALRRGYVCFPTMARDPWLDSLRGNPEFSALRRAAETRYREAVQAFLTAGGDNALGLRPA